MSGLRDHLEGYLALRRALGYKLERPGKLLGQLVAFLDESGHETVTTENALAWATLPAEADPSWWRRRLDTARGFARYLAPLVPGTVIPPRGLLPGPVSRRAVPYLYSPAEVTALMTAAGLIRSPLRAATCQALIGLLAATGMFSRGAKRTCDSFSFFGCSEA